MKIKEIKEYLDSAESLDILRKRVDELEEKEIDEKYLKKYVNQIAKHDKKVSKTKDMKSYEEECKKKYKYVVGIDEVGRGPLAGPVVACSIMMKSDSNILDVDDSKKLTEKKREELYEQIKEEALYIGVGEKSAEYIDKENILNATFKAMEEAFIQMGINKDEVLVLIDGNLKNPKIDAMQETIVKGDSKCYSIACASIIAKVTRDRQMEKLHDEYADYDFASNKGYGTAKHIDALKTKGPIEGIHRKTFIKNLI